jgi:hypothetical protein
MPEVCTVAGPSTGMSTQPRPTQTHGDLRPASGLACDQHCDHNDAAYDLVIQVSSGELDAGEAIATAPNATAEPRT